MMTDVEKLIDTFDTIGVAFHQTGFDGTGYFYCDDDVPKEVLAAFATEVYALGAHYYFDKDGKYLGSVNGDEQPVWEPRS